MRIPCPGFGGRGDAKERVLDETKSRLELVREIAHVMPENEGSKWVLKSVNVGHSKEEHLYHVFEKTHPVPREYI